jgi:hypothetical protein
MNDSLCSRFFLEPNQTLHRRYEALRAVCVDGQPQIEVAQRFGYTYNTMRRLVSDFRAQCRAGQVPPFSLPRNMDDLLDTPMPRHQCPRTPPLLLIRVGWPWPPAAASAPVWQAFSCFSRC